MIATLTEFNPLTRKFKQRYNLIGYEPYNLTT